MVKKLMKGNEAIGEAAIHAGCEAYFAYPITPQTEVAEYLARRMPELGRVFLQAESELAAINMIYGAASAGARVFTSTSSPGLSLMTEAISYIAGSHVPTVLINIVRGGPGLGGILPAQSDYFQATKATGHGDFRCLVLAPSSVQEAVDHVLMAFDLADKYRAPILIIGDGMIGQMMEPVEFPDKSVEPKDLPRKMWSADGLGGREKNIITSLFLDPLKLEQVSIDLKAKYDRMKAEEIRYELLYAEQGYKLLVVAYGTMSRICMTAIEELKVEKGINVGLLRPITLFPFPEIQIFDAAQKAKSVLTIEMSMGQMLEDVKSAVVGSKPVEFFGRTGGIVPSPDDVKKQILLNIDKYK